MNIPDEPTDPNHRRREMNDAEAESENQAAHNQPAQGGTGSTAMDFYKYFSHRCHENVESVLDTAKEWVAFSITKQNEVRSMIDALQELNARMVEEYNDFKLKLTEKQGIRSTLDAKSDLKDFETEIIMAFVAKRLNLNAEKMKKLQELSTYLCNINWYP